MADLLAGKRLREQRAEVAKKVQSLCDRSIRKLQNGGDETPEERAELSAADRQYDLMTAQIIRVEKGWHGMATTHRNLPGRGDFRHVPDDDRDAAASDLDRAIAGWVKNSCGVPVPADLDDACRSIGISVNSGAFDVPITRCRPRLAREWLGRHQQRASEHRALGFGSGPLGGFAVQPGFIARLETAMLEASGMLQAAEIMNTPGGEPLPWPISDDTSNEGEILGENAEVAEQDVSFGQVIFYAHKISSKLVRVSSELIQDSALNIAGEVGAMLGTRIGRTINRLCTVGTGASQPEGLVPGATVGVTAASQTVIAADEILDLVHSVDPSYRSGASFMLHDSVLATIRKLKDGDGQYLWSNGLAAGAPNLLAGYPVIINSHMESTLATGNKVMLFGQLSKYKIRLAGGPRLRRLVERYAERDQEALLAFQRIDGHLLDAGTNPVKVLQMA